MPISSCKGPKKKNNRIAQAVRRRRITCESGTRPASPPNGLLVDIPWPSTILIFCDLLRNIEISILRLMQQFSIRALFTNYYEMLHWLVHYLKILQSLTNQHPYY